MRAVRVEGVLVLPGRRRFSVPAVRPVGPRGELLGPEAHPVLALPHLPEAHPEIRPRAVAGGGAPQRGREPGGSERFGRCSGQVLRGQHQEAFPVPLSVSLVLRSFVDDPFWYSFIRNFLG